MKFNIFICIFLSILTISACSSPRGLAHRSTKATPHIEDIQDAATNNFAKEVFLSPIEVETFVSEGPFGQTSFIASNTYRSALGYECRKVKLSNYNDKVFSVCKIDQDTYKYIEPII